MKIYKTIIFWAILFMSTFLYSQTVSITHVDANCPGQGSATVTTTSVTNPFFQLKDSAGTNIGSGNTHGSFTALDAGTYQVLVTGEAGFTQTSTFTILNNYNPIPTPTISISGLCDNTFTLGGTLSVTMPAVPSGKTYEYKVVKTTDPNFSEALGTYQPISTITNITEFGTYHVRIIDECGQKITIQRDAQPVVQELVYMSFNSANAQACGSGLVDINGINFYTANGSTVGISTYNAYGGIKIEMWERPVGSSCPTAAPASAPIYTGIITSNSGYVIPEVPSKRYIIRITTPCGQSTISCFDAGPGSTPSMVVSSSNEGCGAAQTMTIKGASHVFLNYPVTIQVRNSVGTVVYTTIANGYDQTDNWKAENLPLGDYTVTYTDECNVTLSRPVANPTLTAPTISVAYTKYRCFDDNSGSLTIDGTTQIALTINGYVPNRENATVTIIAGPSNVGVPARIHNNTLYVWTNVVPGNYTIRIDSGCGTGFIDLNFVVNPPGGQILQQSLQSTGSSFCAGGGSISSTIVYTGPFTYTVELLDELGNVIAENSSGTFTNLPHGTYNTRLKVSTCTPAKYYVPNSRSAIVITDASTGPKIIKKVGIVCEDASGTPTSNGTAYFEIAGATPVTVEYKLASATTWTLFSNNAPMAFEIDNLVPNMIYDVRIVSCGTTVVTTVVIQTPGAFSATSMAQPCIGQPYTLSAPEYAGATYQWSNSSGVIANTREFNISNFNTSQNGVYTATITWGGCVVRYFNLIIDSTKCGGPVDEICMEKPVVQDLSNVCPATTVNLDLAHSATMSNGITLQWYKDNLRSTAILAGTEITQAEAGTYYAFYYDSLNNCYSLASNPVVVTINQCKKALIITNPILRNKAK